MQGANFYASGELFGISGLIKHCSQELALGWKLWQGQNLQDSEIVSNDKLNIKVNTTTEQDSTVSTMKISLHKCCVAGTGLLPTEEDRTNVHCTCG